jgi:hypothetical protein
MNLQIGETVESKSVPGITGTITGIVLRKHGSPQLLIRWGHAPQELVHDRAELIKRPSMYPPAPEETEEAEETEGADGGEGGEDALFKN